MLNQKGQILLITIMLITTVLTVVLAVTFKSTTETQLTKLEEESQKALSAAEAGVELALQQGHIKIGELPEFLDTGITGDASIDSKIDTKFVSPLLKKDQQYTFYLADYPNFSQTYSGSIALYFQSEPDLCPSVEMTFLGSEPAAEDSPLPPPPTQTPTPGAATPTPTPAIDLSCYSANTSWQNKPFNNTQYGIFTAEFDVKASNAVDQGDIGFSNGPVSGTNPLIAGIRFNTSYKIRVLDGANGFIQAPEFLPNGYTYENGRDYHFRFVVDVLAQTYSVYVTPAGNPPTEQLLGSGLRFKNTVSQLNNRAIYKAGGASLYYCNFQISGAAEPPTPTPTSGSSSPIEIVSRNIIDPCNKISHSGGGIGSTPSEYSLGGYSFGYKSGAISVSNQVVLVVRSLFESTRIGIESLDGNLPVQGKYVTSEAKTASGVSKKVELFQSYPQIPAEFFVTSF